jgi:hypothetical protein
MKRLGDVPPQSIVGFRNYFSDHECRNSLTVDEGKKFPRCTFLHRHWNALNDLADDVFRLLGFLQRG